MDIKKLLLLISIITLSTVLSSCNSTNDTFRQELFHRDNEEIADTRLHAIIEALENQDSESLKKMFSPNALKEANNIDDGTEYLNKFYQGKVVSEEGSTQVYDSQNNNQRISEMKCFYKVTTDEGKYIVFFIDELIDTKNPDNVGLYMLQIIKLSDREKEFDWGGEKTKCAGIYRPDAEPEDL